MATTRKKTKPAPVQESKPMPKPAPKPPTDWREIIRQFEW